MPYVPPPQPKSPLIYFPDNPGTPLPSSPNPPLILDVIPQILEYVDAPTLSRFSSTCTLFRSLAYKDELWNRLCQTKFGVVATELRPKPDPVRLLYILQVRRMRDVLRMDVNSVKVQRVRGDVLRSVLSAGV